MEKHNFISMINTIEKYNTEIERWDNFGIVLYELPIYDITWKIIDMYLQEIFNEYGVNWIYWYLFERVDITGKVLPCFDEEEKEFYVNNPEDLWKLVKQYQK